MTAAALPVVFVVDDDDLVRSAIQGMLKSVDCVQKPSEPHKSSCAASGRTAQVA